MYVNETPEHAILRLKQEGRTYREIKELIHTSDRRIFRALHIYRENQRCPESAKLGRPSKLTPTLLHFILDTTISEPRISNDELSQRIVDIYGDPHRICPSLISKTRRRLGFLYKPPKLRQDLTAEQKENRVKFARTMLNVSDLLNIIYTDESRFALTSDNQFVWRRRGDHQDVIFSDKKKYPSSCMFFGAIGIDIKSTPVFIECNEDAKTYIETIEKSDIVEMANLKFGDGNWIMMEDGAPAHRSSLAIQVHKSKFNRMTHWPPNSCDCNPIEHLWGAMKKVLSLCHFSNIKEVKTEIVSIWQKVSQETINRLVISFRSRMSGVLAKNGDSISDELRSDIFYFENNFMDTDISGEKFNSWYDHYDPNMEPVEIDHQWKEDEEMVLLMHYTLEHKRGPKKAAQELKIALKECKKHLNVAILKHFRVVAEKSSIFENFENEEK
jgi:transposase